MRIALAGKIKRSRYARGGNSWNLATDLTILRVSQTISGRLRARAGRPRVFCQWLVSMFLRISTLAPFAQSTALANHSTAATAPKTFTGLIGERTKAALAAAKQRGVTSSAG
jgi:hypothetical protein